MASGLSPQFGSRVIAQLKSLEDVGHIMPLPSAQFVAKRARDYAPVDTGYMRDHIHAKQESAESAVVISEAPYSGWVEWGTRYMTARPFLRPAIGDAQRELPRMNAKAVNAEIRRRVARA